MLLKLDPAMMQKLMSNPEFMALVQQPGLMQKLQAIMSNPSNIVQYASDPDVMKLMQLMQSMQ